LTVSADTFLDDPLASKSNFATMRRKPQFG
jgi:hypothetical protein